MFKYSFLCKHTWNWEGIYILFVCCNLITLLSNVLVVMNISIPLVAALCNILQQCLEQ
jgi:hypothetical protein